MAARKLVLVVVDSLRTDMLLKAVEGERAPTFARLLERGELIPDCVSSFPSVTPVACSEITTGVAADRHWISGMNWYHRMERRYVEYGSSLEATRAFGVFRTLYDVVYNMNLAHLSHEVETVFERLGDAGVRTACTPFLIFRGRRRHELSLEGLMRRVALAANFRHAVWGPDELFYGELYASRRFPCKPTLARPGTRAEYSACVGTELVRENLYDFMLFSLPDNDHYSHRHGPEATLDSISHADASLARIVEAAGGFDAFLADHALILLADHAQTEVHSALPLAESLADEWRVLQPNSEHPERAELAVSPTARAAGVYVLHEGRRRIRTHARIREVLRETDGVDLVTWLAGPDGEPVNRTDLHPAESDGFTAVVEGPAGEIRFRPGSAVSDRRGELWELDGDPAALAGTVSNRRFDSEDYPDALFRLWTALNAPQAGDVVVSAEPGYECVDWGGATHVGGGSHGSLHVGDSVGPLLFVGCGPARIEADAQWALRDVAGAVLDHFGLGATA
jgi:predicted AlkP superfamily pyrophosphatase or phosphodiesterase